MTLSPFAVALAVLLSSAVEPVLGGQSRTGPALEITYLANMGVALDDGERAVLIDALFDGGVKGYPRLPRSTRERLLRGELFDRPVTLALATHFHDDHFDAATVAAFLDGNPSARFVSTPQAVDALRPHLDDGPSKRVAAFLPAEGELLELPALATGGTPVTVLQLHHGRQRRPPVENLGFLLELAGVRVLHVGDTEVRAGDLVGLTPADLDLDVGLLPTWLLRYDGWRDVTRKVFAPRHVIALHVPAANAPPGFFGSDRDLEGLLDAVRSALPAVEIGLEPGESWSFPRGGDR